MKREVSTKKTSEEAAKAISSDPFESLAEPAEVVKAGAPAASVPEPKKRAPLKRVKKAPAGSKGIDAFEAPAVEAVPATTPVSSPVKKREVKAKAVKAPAVKKTSKKAAGVDVTSEIAAAKSEVEVSPVFKALAEPVLPALERENRARLLMQSPTKLFFYWSVKENPYQLLRDAFGTETGSYTLVLKLSDITTGVETMHQAEPAGEWWFDVEADREYQAEIGFYAPNRPYFRIIYSNTIETPRRSPSPHKAAEAKWTVSANKFAEVLDVSGFTRDAFDVALAGDDVPAADESTMLAFTSLTGASAPALTGISAEDMRRVMVALAAGQKLEELRSQISRELFAVLQRSAGDLKARRAKSVLSEYFDVDDSEFTEEQFGPAVFGVSLVHFPRTLKTRTASGRYSPVSSPALRA